MKATLIMEGVRATVDLGKEDAAQVVKAFIRSMENHLDLLFFTELHIPASPASEVGPSNATEVPPVSRSGTSSASSFDTKLSLFLISCPQCGKTFGLKKPMSFGSSPNDIVSCNCGAEIQITEVKKASGQCENCGADFWNWYVTNGLREKVCNKCQGIIDLFEKPDGTLTNASGVRAL